MFTYKKKIIKTVKTAEGDTTTEEVVEQSSGTEAEAKAEAMMKEADAQFKKMDAFFKKMDEAF